MPAQDDSAVLLRAVEELGHAREEIEQLKAGLISRQMIGVAQGMLMLRYSLTLDRSFEYLSRRSQDENIKLRLVAERVIAELSADASGQP